MNSTKPLRTPPRLIHLPARACPRRALLAAACATLLAAPAVHAVDDGGPAEPIVLQADRLRSITDGETEASGDVELRQGPTRIRADRLRYSTRDDRARVEGSVRIEREGALYFGPAAELTIGTLEGWFLEPEFEFLRLGTRGAASRIDFQGRSRLNAADARYTSCPRDGSGDPDWVLQARSVTLDFDANEGRADGAVLRFLGVPILAAPGLSFPVTDARKSGWLPPSLNIDSSSGVEFSMPWYWNIAPNLDATIAPRIMTRRGIGVDGEFRYLQPNYQGRSELNWLPHDRVYGEARFALTLQHEHALPLGIRGRFDAIRVSDDDWWKDFTRATSSLTPRLLPLVARAERDFGWRGGEGQAYLRIHRWQVLQDIDAPIVEPYARSPQLGVRTRGRFGELELSLVTELNHFVLAERAGGDLRPDGWRWHASGVVAWPWRASAGGMVPRLTVNASHCRSVRPLADGRREAARLLPTLSVDAGLAFERDTDVLFGRALRQTLEPRLFYVYTPYKRQDQLPNFDAFGKEFNFSSIYSDNAFSGVDRISDSHQLTAGATTRLIDAADGAELLRLGVAQRFLFRDQRVAPALDGSVDGAPLEQRFSDVLLLASTTLVPQWSLDAALQYSQDNGRLRRSLLGATWSPAPFHTLNMRYRLARGLSEQVEAGWQWPVYRGDGQRSGGRCQGTLYGVGRINYSLRDSRITDSVLGLEYDAGCWIGRIVAERLSTGRTEATTRLLLQLELVGLSRLGSNPLQVLKDNIPGYRLLRDDPSSPRFP